MNKTSAGFPERITVRRTKSGQLSVGLRMDDAENNAEYALVKPVTKEASREAYPQRSWRRVTLYMRTTGRICDDRSRDGPKNPAMQYIPVNEVNALLENARAEARSKALELGEKIGQEKSAVLHWRLIVENPGPGHSFAYDCLQDAKRRLAALEAEAAKSPTGEAPGRGDGK